MDLEEQKKIAKRLITSQDFIESMDTCWSKIDPHSVSFTEISLWFYAKGYLCAIEDQKNEITRPYSFKDN